MSTPKIKAPGRALLGLAAKWADVARREKQLREEKGELGKELLPLVRPHGEIVLEDGVTVSLDRGSTRADATLGRLAAFFGAERAKAFWSSLPENGYERLHLREILAPKEDAA